MHMFALNSLALFVGLETVRMLTHALVKKIRQELSMNIRTLKHLSLCFLHNLHQRSVSSDLHLAVPGDWSPWGCKAGSLRDATAGSLRDSTTGSSRDCAIELSRVSSQPQAAVQQPWH